ncbi:WD40-repeat-containing domain protein [Chlamydoabsidia padenii]|nr:WD40-repeat-containing domain protein [Chlamydoabsidia padenii]
MIIYKPSWVCHEDTAITGKKQCIYSIDVHPNGGRLATGSLDTTVKIWNTDPIYNEKLETDSNCQKLLCTLSLHSGAVLCVRWSKDGRYLASGSEKDNMIIIWELDCNNTGDNHESWRAVKHLRDHNSDVLDLVWSNDNRYLASCSMDGFIIIWDAQTFEQVHKINQQGGFVKGVTWDPVGNYLASQSNDKMVKIWRTSDWKEEARVEGLFHNVADNTFFRRLSWSPEGTFVVAANATNANQCVAALIGRDQWDSHTSLVGHAFPVEVALFNPKLFYISDTENNSNDMDIDDTGTDNNNKGAWVSVCALGGQDRGISIWMTKRTRPLCVFQNIFENNVYDLAWTPDGQTLFACSQDGTIACLQLQEELMIPSSNEEILKSLEQYGYRQDKKQLPSWLDLEGASNTSTEPQTSQRIADLMGGGNGISDHTNDISNHMELDNDGTAAQLKTTTNDKQTHEFTSVSASAPSLSSLSNIASTITEQKVTIAKNGKRRIQPISVSRHSSPHVQNNPPQVSSPTPSQQPLVTNSSQETSGYDLPCMDTQDHRNGNKRKKADDISAQSVRLKPTWVDAGIVPPLLRQSQVRLGLPKVKSVMVNHLSAADSISMECHNGSGKQGLECTKLLLRQHGNILWTDYLTSAILVMTGNRIFSAIGCEDGSILIYSPAGRRILPPIVLDSTPVMMTSNDQWLLCLTATGLLYTWDIIHQKCQLSAVSISPLLRVAQVTDELQPAPSLKDVRIQKNGTPFVITNYHQAFSYDTSMNSWLRISDAWFIISEFWGSSTQQQHPLGWLSTALKMTGDSTNDSILALARMDPEVSSTVTISHIENQLAAALVLESTTEYKEWMIYYARRLSKENAQSKVEELCRWLMGPPYMPMENDKWEPTILNSIPKHELLKELLPILAQNRQLQRITTEYQSMLLT